MKNTKKEFCIGIAMAVALFTSIQLSAAPKKPVTKAPASQKVPMSQEDYKASINALTAKTDKSFAEATTLAMDLIAKDVVSQNQQIKALQTKVDTLVNALTMMQKVIANHDATILSIAKTVYKQ